MYSNSGSTFEITRNKTISVAFLLLLCLIFLSIVLFTAIQNSNTFCGMNIITDLECITDKQRVHFDTLCVKVENVEVSCLDDDWFLLPETTGDKWQITVKTTDDAIRLYILNDEYMTDKQEAISNNHAFQVIFVKGDFYDSRIVKFTNIPIMSIETETGNVIDRNSVITSITLFDNRYQNMLVKRPLWVQQMQARMRVRGNASAGEEKKGYKINLLDSDYQSMNSDLLGLYNDNDWDLDAIHLDKSKVREQVVSYFGNLIEQDRNYPHCTFLQGEFIELTLNGEYQGLYRLHTHLDRKWLEINNSDSIAVKLKYYFDVSESNWEKKSIYTEYIGCFFPLEDNERTFSEEDWEVIHRLSRAFFQKDSNTVDEILPSLDLDNQIDQAILVNVFDLQDNHSRNNVGYVYDRKTGKYYRTMWDFDNALYRENVVLETAEIARLIATMPEMQELLRNRWNVVKETVFTIANIDDIFNTTYDELLSCGALYRESERWPNSFNITVSETAVLKMRDELKTILKNRVALMERYYNCE